MAETQEQAPRQIIVAVNQKLTPAEIEELAGRGLMSSEMEILYEERRQRELTQDEKDSIIRMLNEGMKPARCARFWDLDPKRLKKLRKEWGMIS